MQVSLNSLRSVVGIYHDTQEEIQPKGQNGDPGEKEVTFEEGVRKGDEIEEQQYSRPAPARASRSFSTLI